MNATSPENNKDKSLKPLRIVFLFAAILAPIIGFAVGTFVGRVDVFGLAGMSYLWVMFPFVVLPVLSIVFGAVSLKKKAGGRGNVIVGAISSALILIIGCYSFLERPDKSGAFLRDASEATGIVLPSDVWAMSYSSYGGRMGNAIVLDNEQLAIFESETLTDRWVHELPAGSKGLLPTSLLMSSRGFDRYSMFVSPINQFNPNGLDSGNYDITFLAYKKEKKQIRVFDLFQVMV